jgi:hypothetical protein
MPPSAEQVVLTKLARVKSRLLAGKGALS